MNEINFKLYYEDYPHHRGLDADAGWPVPTYLWGLLRSLGRLIRKGFEVE